MKNKLLFLGLLLGLMVGFASCSQDGDEPTPPPVQVNADGTVTVDFAVQPRQGIRSRASYTPSVGEYGDGTKATQLDWYLYEGDSKEPVLSSNDENAPKAQLINGTFSFSLNLNQKKTYKIALMASDGKHYTLSKAENGYCTIKRINVNTEPDMSDVFCGVFDVNAGSNRTNCDLTRPTIQINIVTDEDTTLFDMESVSTELYWLNSLGESVNLTSYNEVDKSKFESSDDGLFCRQSYPSHKEKSVSINGRTLKYLATDYIFWSEDLKTEVSTEGGALCFQFKEGNTIINSKDFIPDEDIWQPNSRIFIMPREGYGFLGDAAGHRFITTVITDFGETKEYIAG